MSDQNEAHVPTPEEEARRIMEILADVDANRARIGQVALVSASVQIPMSAVTRSGPRQL